MKHTVRYTHLEKMPILKVGDKVYTGDKIGKMGNTGASTAPHLHFDCVRGERSSMYTLAQMANEEVKACPIQTNYFIDDQLFKTKIHITTYYNDPEYLRIFGKTHLAYDVVPKNRHVTDANYTIYWNRSMTGTVTAVGYDKGYGYYVMIKFDT